MAGFEQALKQLVEDSDYRAKVAKDSAHLKTDHKLSAQELVVLMQVWVNSDEAARMSIWDMCHCCCSTTASKAQ